MSQTGKNVISNANDSEGQKWACKKGSHTFLCEKDSKKLLEIEFGTK
jgi:hypothetical protein